MSGYPLAKPYGRQPPRLLIPAPARGGEARSVAVEAALQDGVVNCGDQVRGRRLDGKAKTAWKIAGLVGRG